MKQSAWFCSLAMIALLVGSSCSRGNRGLPVSAEGQTQLKLALNWFPEPEHGGYYAALLNGHFAAEGLDVEILPGGPNTPVIEKLVRGQVQFSVANADEVLLKRNQQTAVVGLFAPLQKTPRCIMVHEESGIERLKDLAKLNLAMNKGKAFAEYIEQHCPLDQVRIVPYNGRIGPFVADKNYAQQAYVFSEPILAQREGAHPRCLMVSDLGYNPYTSCLVATQELVDQHPDVVQRFVRASQKGWQDYLEDPSKVNAELLKLNSELDAESLTLAHAALVPLCQVQEGTPVGSMTLERWQLLKDQLVEIKFVAEDLEAAAAFDTRFTSNGNTSESTEPTQP